MDLIWDFLKVLLFLILLFSLCIFSFPGKISVAQNYQPTEFVTDEFEIMHKNFIQLLLIENEVLNETAILY